MPPLGKGPAADDGCGPPQPIPANVIQSNQKRTKKGQEPALFARPRINDLVCRFKSPRNQYIAKLMVRRLFEKVSFELFFVRASLGQKLLHP